MEETKGTERLRNLPRATDLSERQGWDLEGAHETCCSPRVWAAALVYWGVRRWGGTPVAVPPLNTGHTPAGTRPIGSVLQPSPQPWGQVRAQTQTPRGKRRVPRLTAWNREWDSVFLAPSALQDQAPQASPGVVPLPTPPGRRVPADRRGWGRGRPRTAQKLPTPRPPPVSSILRAGGSWA